MSSRLWWEDFYVWTICIVGGIWWWTNKCDFKLELVSGKSELLNFLNGSKLTHLLHEEHKVKSRTLARSKSQAWMAKGWHLNSLVNSLVVERYSIVQTQNIKNINKEVIFQNVGTIIILFISSLYYFYLTK